jgi:hypothetical protein
MRPDDKRVEVIYWHFNQAGESMLARKKIAGCEHLSALDSPTLEP